MNVTARPEFDPEFDLKAPGSPKKFLGRGSGAADGLEAQKNEAGMYPEFSS
jgi:hypothetical protein